MGSVGGGFDIAEEGRKMQRETMREVVGYLVWVDWVRIKRDARAGLLSECDGSWRF